MVIYICSFYSSRILRNNENCGFVSFLDSNSFDCRYKCDKLAFISWNCMYIDQKKIVFHFLTLWFLVWRICFFLLYHDIELWLQKAPTQKYNFLEVITDCWEFN